MIPQRYFAFVNLMAALGVIGAARVGLPYPFNLAESLMVFPWAKNDRAGS